MITYLVTAEATRNYNTSITADVTHDEQAALESVRKHAKRTPHLKWHITRIETADDGTLINRERIEYGNK